MLGDKQRKINYFLIGFLFTAIFSAVFLVGNFVFAEWTEPSVSAPGGNISAPINIGNTSQTKTGSLRVENGITTNQLCLGLSESDCKSSWDTLSIWNSGANGIYYDAGNVAVGPNFLTGGSDWPLSWARLSINMGDGIDSEREGLYISRDQTSGFSYLNIEDENFNPIFRVHESGNVGIGKPTPGANLDVAGDIKVGTNLQFSSGATLYGGVLSVNNYGDNDNTLITQDNFTIGMPDGSDTMAMYFYQGSGGTAGQYSSIRSDYDNFYLSNNTGKVIVESASDKQHAFSIQEGFPPYQSQYWWFDGSSGDATGMWWETATLAGGMNFKFGNDYSTTTFRIMSKDENEFFSVDTSGDVKINTGDLQMADDTSIVLNSLTASTTLLVGNYASDGFVYGSGINVANLAVEGSIKGNQLCFKDDCKTSWAEVITGSGYWSAGVDEGEIYYSGGNVGIGTDNPARTLTIAHPSGYGDIYLQDINNPTNNRTGGTYLRSNEGILTIQGMRSDIAVGSYLAMVLDHSLPSQAKLGISTTSPEATLHLVNNGTHDSFLVEDDTAPDATPFVIDASGNTGIGIRTPNKALHIYRSGENAEIDIESGLATTGHWGIYQQGFSTEPTFNSLVFWNDGFNRVSFSDDGIVKANDFCIDGGDCLSTGGGGTSLWSQNSTDPNKIYYNGGNVGIGTDDPGAKLTIKSSGINSFLISGLASGSSNSLWRLGEGANSVGTFSLLSSASNKIFFTAAASDSYINTGGDFGIGLDDPAEKLEVLGNIKINGGDLLMSNNKAVTLNDSASDTNLIVGNFGESPTFTYNSGKVANLAVEGRVQGGQLCIAEDCKTSWPSGGTSLWSQNSTDPNKIYYNGGNVGIGTDNPNAKFQVQSNGVGIVHSNGAGSYRAYTMTAGDNAQFVLRDASDNNDIILNTNGNSYFNGGNVGIGTDSPNKALHVYRSGENAEINIQSISGVDNHWGIYHDASSDDLKFWKNSFDRMTLGDNGDLWVYGNITAGGGGDVAEEFKSEDTMEEGTVMVMGDSGYKSVKSSWFAYDKTVVGVISDDAGVIIGQVDDEKSVPIAMVGVVGVKVSTENGAIKKGDLLVTSSISGHAMRTDDPKVGTVIGKALESFGGKTGVIKVLINLQ